MLFTELKFDPKHIAQVVEQRKAGLLANRGLSDLRSFGLKVVAQRLEASPSRYLDYGPYWWALKAVMRDAGYPVGEQSDPLVQGEYAGVDEVSTIIAADEFRADYLSKQLIGANEHILVHGDPEPYLLFDADFEGRLSWSAY